MDSPSCCLTEGGSTTMVGIFHLDPPKYLGQWIQSYTCCLFGLSHVLRYWVSGVQVWYIRLQSKTEPEEWTIDPSRLVGRGPKQVHQAGHKDP